MADFSERFSGDMDKLREVRDELRVQLHLGAAEARDAWHEVEQRWQHLEAKLKLLRDESRDDLAEIGEATSLLLGEIRDSYSHLRRLL
jgi:hypothetical protein